MSDVYVALHTGLRKRFALKMLRASLRSDADAVQRFLREGECAARVCHPNVVDVSDVGVDDGVPYLVMELLEGETLAQLLDREGPLSLERAVDVLLPILDAIATAHAEGVLHRDIKPANILLARAPDGSVKPKLVDFGIAQLRGERDEPDGAQRGPIGTPHYMSPEQARGEHVDEKSDQYAIGSVLFEMLSGREPYRGGSVEQVLARVARGNFPTLASAVPEQLGAVLARTTARCPAQRFGSVAELSEALVPFASARTQRLWVSRAQRSGVCSAQLLSGAYHEARREPPAVSARLGPSASHLRSRRRSSLRGVGGAALLSLGLLTGVWVTEGEAKELEAAQLAAASADVASEPTTSLAALPTLVTEVRGGGVVRTVPEDAVVSFDGVALGRGRVVLPELGDRLHELRVTAPGYVDRVLLFHGAVQADAIILEPRR